MLRKIKTKEEIHRKNKQNQILVGTVMILILVISTAGFSIISRTNEVQDSSTKIDQNGFSFYQDSGRWTTDFNGQVLTFAHLPSQVSTIPAQISLDINTYSNQPLYFVGSSNALPEILNILQRYSERYQEACIENQPCEGDLPIKNCENNIIILDEKGEIAPTTTSGSAVYQENNCIYIVGEQTKTADAFLYKVLKIN